MKIGIDVGNYTTSSSQRVIFESRCSQRSKELYAEGFILNDKEFFIEQGTFDSTYRKVDKESYIKLLYAALCKSADEINIELAVGLPLSQYKNDKEKLEELIMQNAIMRGTKNFIIRDVQVFPEGVVTTTSNYEGILVDIGGRTTDICFIEQVNGRRKVMSPKSIANGMLDLEKDFIEIINSKFGSNFKITDFKRVLKNGVNIYGVKQDISFAIDVFKDFLEELLRDINADFNLSQNEIVFTGGGSTTLKNSILKRVPNAVINSNAIMANAIAYRKMLGE